MQLVDRSTVPYRYLSRSGRAENALSSVSGRNPISISQNTINQTCPVIVFEKRGAKRTDNSDSRMMILRFAANADDLREILAQTDHRD